MRALVLFLGTGVLIGFAAGMVVGHAGAQAKPRMWADTVVDVVTEELPRKARVRTNVNHWDAGAETGRHTHAGPTVIVVLEGELEERLPDGRTRVLKAGHGYWNPARYDHNVRNVGGQPARVVAVHLDPVR